MTSTATLQSPPRARLAFRVGAVGHRPDRLPKDADSQTEIRRWIAAALDVVAATTHSFRNHPDAVYYSREAPILRALSPLAEGADRIFADEALARGYELCAPMPFPQAEYEKDFAEDVGLEPNSVERFRSILRTAAEGPGLSTFELAGARDDPAEAYGAAGRLVLNQSDLLLVVWDGGLPNGGGGTIETLREAIRYRVPVLWIDARAPYGWMVLRDQRDLECLEGVNACSPFWDPTVTDDMLMHRLTEALSEIVLNEFRRPAEHHLEGHGDGEAGTPPVDHAAIYFAERKPSFNGGFLWKPFRNFVGSGRLTAPSFGVRNFLDQIRAQWPVDGETGAVAENPVTSWINGKLRPHFAWADGLADCYADAHRSAFIVASIMASMAVFVALLPIALGWVREGHEVADALCISFEFLILGMMVFLLGQRHRWHERWLEYRVLAELIRQLRILAPLGGGRPLPRTPAHLITYGDPVGSWMYWHMRAIARETGLPDVKATAIYTTECLDYLVDVVKGPVNGQLGFHQTNDKRSETIHARLHEATLWLFRMSILGIGLHLALMAPTIMSTRHILTETMPVEATHRMVEPLDHLLSGWLIMTAAFAPALGAAIASINNQGEFSRLSKRSRAMEQIFKRFGDQIDRMRDLATSDGRSITLAAVSALATQIAERMIEENLDWRVVVLDLPHVSG